MKKILVFLFLLLAISLMASCAPVNDLKITGEIDVNSLATKLEKALTSLATTAYDLLSKQVQVLISQTWVGMGVVIFFTVVFLLLTIWAISADSAGGAITCVCFVLLGAAIILDLACKLIQYTQNPGWTMLMLVINNIPK